MSDERNPPDIIADGVSVSYGKGKQHFHAIRGVSLQVNRGELIAIVGPSGCGKSTLLRVLANLIPPTEGTVVVPDERAKVGFVPQAPQLLPWRTLLQNAVIGSELHGSVGSVAVERVFSMIGTYRLSGFEDCYPHELSGGMAQRVSLIRALQFRPSLLFCDEPFSAIDFVTRFEFNTIFRAECSTRGITTVLVTHNIEEAIYLGDRIVLMGGKPGRILKSYPARYLPDRHDAVLCRNSDPFREFFSEIWQDLKAAYAIE